jgi:hypothetical protein
MVRLAACPARLHGMHLKQHARHVLAQCRANKPHSQALGSCVVLLCNVHAQAGQCWPATPQKHQCWPATPLLHLCRLPAGSSRSVRTAGPLRCHPSLDTSSAWATGMQATSCWTPTLPRWCILISASRLRAAGCCRRLRLPRSGSPRTWWTASASKASKAASAHALKNPSPSCAAPGRRLSPLSRHSPTLIRCGRALHACSTAVAHAACMQHRRDALCMHAAPLRQDAPRASRKGPCMGHNVFSQCPAELCVLVLAHSHAWCPCAALMHSQAQGMHCMWRQAGRACIARGSRRTLRWMCCAHVHMQSPQCKPRDSWCTAR